MTDRETERQTDRQTDRDRQTDSKSTPNIDPNIDPTSTQHRPKIEKVAPLHPQEKQEEEKHDLLNGGALFLSFWTDFGSLLGPS